MEGKLPVPRCRGETSSRGAGQQPLVLSEARLTLARRAGGFLILHGFGGGWGGKGLDRAEDSSVLNRFSAQIPGAPWPLVGFALHVKPSPKPGIYPEGPGLAWSLLQASVATHSL